MKKDNTPDIPLCTNVMRLQSYLLPPDEVVLFDWFIVKQTSFKYKEFHYSQARIEEETRIKRTRQEIIISRFKDIGFLKYEVKENKDTRGRVRYFKVDFEILSDKDILSEIINQKDAIFKSFIKYVKHLASEQKKHLKSQKKDDFNIIVADRIYKMLNDTYDKRRIMYNNGEITSEKPERAKSKTQLPRNKAIDRKLARLSGKYEDSTIDHSFASYVDSVFSGDSTPDNFMNYFLSYDDVSGSFNVFDYHLNYFNLNYGSKNK